MNHSQQEYLHYSEASILYEWSENLSPKTSKCSLWRTSLLNALGITLGICCILSKLNGHTVLPNAPVTCTLEGNFGPQPLKLLEFSSFLSLVYLSSLLLIVINVSEKNFFSPSQSPHSLCLYLLSTLLSPVCLSFLTFSFLSFLNALCVEGPRSFREMFYILQSTCDRNCSTEGILLPTYTTALYPPPPHCSFFCFFMFILIVDPHASYPADWW